MTAPNLAAIFAEIDAYNARDPRKDPDTGTARELLYADRMTAWLDRLYPAASDELRVASRAQHIGRWEIPRADYPLGRQGYNAWRSACRDRHAALTAEILTRHGWPADRIAHVGKILKKEQLKRDPDSQALENVVGAVFVAHYLEAFVAEHPDYDDAKLVDILRKTLAKMDETGRSAVAAMEVPAALRRVLGLVLG